MGNGGSGTFTQSGGTHTVTGNLSLDSTAVTAAAPMTSREAASSAVFRVSSAFTGIGTFTQSGGTHTVSDTLSLAEATGRQRFL